MPEEKKIKLNRESLTQHGNEITTTQHTSPDVTQEVKQHWRFKDDGTENTPLVEQYNADKQRIDSQYHVDPNTGEVDGDKFLFETFGIKPEDLRRKREAEMELNRRKQKESALYNALAVIGDMFTTAGGGNVWQRQPNNKAKEAADRNLALEHEQRAEDAQNHQLVSNAKKAYAAEVAKLNDAYQKAFGSTRKVTQKGDTVTTKQRDNDETIGYIEQQVYPQRGGNGSGSSKDRIVNVDITQPDGTIKRNSYTVDSEEKYKALQGILKRHYNNILTGADEKAQELYKRLMDSHVIKGVDAQGQYVFDDELLLKNGQFWYLDDPTRRRIEKDVPGIKFKFKDQKGWGVVTQTPPDF